MTHVAKVCLTLLAAAALLPLQAGTAAADPAVAGEYPVPGGLNTNAQIALGPDGAMWVPVEAGNDYARIAPDGTVIEFNAADVAAPVGMAAGPDGNLWVTQAGSVARFAPASPTVATKFPIAEIADPRAITAGPDGNLWTASGDKVIRIPPGNPAAYTAFPVAGMAARWITAATDGTLWVADFAGSVVNLTTAGAPTSYAAPGGPQGIAAGPGGQVAFSNPGANPQYLARLAPGGVPAAVATPMADPFGVALGPDGAYWFAQFNANNLARATPDGASVTVFSGFSAAAGPRQLAAGPDNTLWVVLDTAEKVAKVTGVTPPAPPAPPPPPAPPAPTPAPTPAAGNPTPLALTAVSRNSKLRVQVAAPCTTQFRFRVQKAVERKGVVVKWRKASKWLKTKGSGHVRTVNRGKGLYRVSVKAGCGYDPTVSAPVRLVR